jgi:dTDP-4-dehydrorhamnose reductase
MRIVLTGVTGQVGKRLAATLEKLGTVVTADRSILDLAKPGTLREALDRLAPDLIVNPAAYTAVDRAEDEWELAFTVNAEAPGVLAEWSSAKGIPLVHFSTDYVFDGEGEKPWKEDSPTGPLSAYGASKLAGEVAVRKAEGAHLIVRTSWVYAAQGSNFLRTVARLARERSELRIVGDQVGSPTSAQVIAEAVTNLLASDPGNLAQSFAKAGGILNVATSSETSWHGFATRIVDGLKSRGISLSVQAILPIRTEEYPTKAVRPRNCRLDLTRLREVYGVTTPLWNDALEPELDQLSEEMRGS